MLDLPLQGEVAQFLSPGCVFTIRELEHYLDQFQDDDVVGYGWHLTEAPQARALMQLVAEWGLISLEPDDRMIESVVVAGEDVDFRTPGKLVVAQAKIERRLANRLKLLDTFTGHQQEPVTRSDVESVLYVSGKRKGKS